MTAGTRLLLLGLACLPACLPACQLAVCHVSSSLYYMFLTFPPLHMNAEIINLTLRVLPVFSQIRTRAVSLTIRHNSSLSMRRSSSPLPPLPSLASVRVTQLRSAFGFGSAVDSAILHDARFREVRGEGRGWKRP